MKTVQDQSSYTQLETNNQMQNSFLYINTVRQKQPIQEKQKFLTGVKILKNKSSINNIVYLLKG